VQAKPRLFADVKALLSLCEDEAPPWRQVRPKRTAMVIYGFGDASGSAYGASSQVAGADEFHFEFGQWIASVTEEESSNWREFTNVVEYLERRGADGHLDESEVFMFTDNSVTEAAFWKGNSHSRKLCALVLRLRQLEMRTGMILHVVHVSGKRMIAQGTDGLSRGDHSTGVMRGEKMEAFVPLHKSALERSPALRPWLEDVLIDHGARFLSAEGWFEDTDREGTFVWTPAPAAADIVVERLAQARHKRPNSLHLVVVPRLMTGRWRKQLLKACDFSCRISLPSLWDLESQFEPLLIFVCLPFLPHRPDFDQRKGHCEGLRRILQPDDLSETDPEVQGNLLRKLLLQARTVSSL
jgi:hypothetical protein